jgi:hypothetical protein
MSIYMFILNGTTYKTKIATKKAIQDKIKQLDLCIIGQDHKEFPFFKDLIYLHENRHIKIGNGLKQFHIRRNPINYNERTLWVERLDGTEDTWSYKACLNIKQNDLTAALRSAIGQFTIMYKMSLPKLYCCYCNTYCGPFHVDHKTISFSKIKDDFLKNVKLPLPNTFQKDSIYFNVMFLDSNRDFMDEWIKYHNSVADYQILCATCNQEKSNK